MARLRLRLSLQLLALGVLLVAGVGGCQRSGLSEGDKAPEFLLQRSDGAVRKLRDYRGRILLLNLWATWCPPCRAEIHLLNAIERDFSKRGVAVLGLAGDEDPAAVHRFIDEFNVEFEVLLDPDGAVGTEYGITGYPETFLIDREGRVRGKYIGPLPHEQGKPAKELVDRIEALIDE